MSKRNEVTDFIYAALFAALIAVLGLVSIPLPISPVPVTGQSLAIMLAGSILTVRQAAYSVLTFLLLGAVGVPVFAGMTGGIGILVGPRGGYLFGFLVGAIVIALLKGQNNNKWRLALANMVGGIIVVYTFGMLWLNFVTGMGLEKALMVGVLPYIPGDLFKVFAATIIGIAVNSQLQKTRLRP
ncbi:MAG: BioY protein [Pelosinus sp.]|jgi:biotin transport system substrate-specific component|nr:BioY protein [Pelosinus sp.]